MEIIGNRRKIYFLCFFKFIVISCFFLLLLGATPERAEFEASIDQDSEPPSIMDEDEWTDRNFGGNSLIIINDEEDDNNTSEDRYCSFHFIR